MIAPMPFFEDRGTPIRVYEEAKNLTILGNQVNIICYHLGRDIADINNIQRILKIPWYKKTIAGPSYHKIYLDILLLFKTFKIIKENKFNILHAHLHEGAFISQILKKILKINTPIIFDAHGSLTLEMIAHDFIKESSLFSRFWKLIEKKINEGSGVILASNPNLIEIMKNDFLIPQDKIKFIPDGVDTNLFDPTKCCRREIRKKYNLEDNEIIVYTGLFTKYQGLNFLIEKVIPKVLNEYKNAKFLLVGYPINEYRIMAKKSGVEKNIIFTGKQRYQTIPKFLTAADIAVTPKYLDKGEGNLKISTYMSMGLPTVSFNYLYNKTMLKCTGITTRPNNAEDFANAILTLLDNPKKRMLMGKKAKIIANKEYSWLSLARKIERVYMSMINTI